MSAQFNGKVIGIPGYLGSGNMPWWGWLEKYLKNDGVELVDSLYDRQYGAFSESVDPVKENAEKVRAAVEEVFDDTGERVNLIAHSKGGIDGRYFIEHGGGRHLVENFITVATPHGGTKAAEIAEGKLETAAKILDGASKITGSDTLEELGQKTLMASEGAKDLRRDSEVIESFDPENLGQVDVYTVRSDYDELVLPQENAAIPGEYDTITNIGLEGMWEHVEMIGRKPIYNKIRSYVT